MTPRRERDDAKLALVRRDREVIAKAIREHRATKVPATVAPTARWWVAISLALVAACGGGGGGKKSDTYTRASHVEAECCEHLSGPSRDQCLGELVKVSDKDVAKTDVNQETYACVAEHFVCDPNTGHPTQPSAQAQLECIQDLQ